MIEVIAEAERRQDGRENITAQKEDESRVKYMQLCAGIRELLRKRDIPLHPGASGSDMIAVLHQVSGNRESVHSGEHFSASWSDEYGRLAQGVGAVAHTSFDKDSDSEAVLSALRERLN